MTNLAFLDIYSLTKTYIRRSVQVSQFHRAGIFWLYAFRNMLSQPLHISHHTKHLFAETIQFLSVQTSLHAFIHSILYCFNLSASFSKLWIGRRHCSKTISKRSSTCINVTILAIKAIALFC